MADDSKPTPAERAEMERARAEAARDKKEKAAPTTKTGMGDKLFAKGGSIADKGRKFRTGGRPAAINKQNTQHGSMDMPFNMKTGGKMKDKMGMKMGGMHKMPDGKMMKDSAMKKGGMPMKDGKPAFMMGKKMMGGGMSGYAKGGGIESKGKTKGTVIRMASGGSVSARADGIAQRGKTKFKMC